MSSIIDKLPYSWRDVKKTLKHKQEEMDINQLGTHLQIEVNIRAQESGGTINTNISSINMVEKILTYQREKRKGNQASSSQKGKGAKTTQPDKNACWIYGKLGHQKKDCYINKRRMKAFEKNKGNGSSNNDPNMQRITSQIDLNFGLDLNQID